MEERRRNYRWELLIPCQCDWRDRSINAEVSDISFGGASITHPLWVPETGEEVSMTFYSDTTVFLRARVIHRRDRSESPSGYARFGLEFEGSLEERSRKLVNLISAYAASSMIPT